MRYDKLCVTGLFAMLTLLCATESRAEKLGKLFIKAGSADVNGQQFVDKELEDSVTDLKRRSGDFTVVDREADADFLMVVIKRQVELKGHGSENNKRLYVTLSVRDGAAWKPGVQLAMEGSRQAGRGALRRAA